MRRGRLQAAALLLVPAAAWLAVGAWPLLAQLADGTVQIQDGGGNVPDSLTTDELIVVLIQDSDLHGSNAGVATWTNIPEEVQAYEVWSLVTGSPHSSVHSLSGGDYDTDAPEKTPLLTVAAEVDGEPNIVSDFDFDPGVLRAAVQHRGWKQAGGDVHVRRGRLALIVGPGGQGDEQLRRGRGMD